MGGGPATGVTFVVVFGGSATLEDSTDVLAAVVSSGVTVVADATVVESAGVCANAAVALTRRKISKER
jgi:hypothetical protein